MDAKDFLIQQLGQLAKEQGLLIKQLQDEIVELKAEVQLLKRPKNSNTSSIPPSKDENRKTRGLREKTGKKPGGQDGHKGTTLKMSGLPDEVVVHSPGFCQNCSKDISTIPGELRQKRQVVDLPVARPLYTEHQCYNKACTCGHVNKSMFPPQVKAPVQYGPNIESTIAYLSTRQYMPYGRICEHFRDVHGLPISEGSVENLLRRFARKAGLAYQRIRENISCSAVVGADETGAKINGEKAWVHTWQDRHNTLVAVSNSRGNRAINENFPDGFPMATLVSDAWAPQLSTVAKSHQLCTAHLLRELNYFMDQYKDGWSGEAKSIFLEAIKLKKAMTAGQYGGNCHGRDMLEERLDRLLERPPDEKHIKIKPFWKRLIKNRGSLFVFLYDAEVPPDNNGSERAIRNIKVKQKVSCQFKSFIGAEIFVTIRSVIDTVLKRNGNVFECLNLTANLVLPE